MSEFSISNLAQSAIQYLYSIRKSIWIAPPYQRLSDIWPLDKRQLLIDSVLNGFDIPKLYFHELDPARRAQGQFQKYAIIDGKQRLEALWAFMDGEFSLAKDFEYLFDKNVKLHGFTYRDIGDKYPLIKSRFDATSLTVVTVRTNDTELIEEMFSRLNEAVPLNAPEKRNAFPGPLPKIIREVADHDFFTERIPYSDRRYKHRDLAAKFLMIEHRDEVTDTKKTYLDDFVEKWPNTTKGQQDAKNLKTNVETHLNRMSKVFVNDDVTLKSIGMTILIFHYFRLVDKLGLNSKVKRAHFEAFEAARVENRQLAEAKLSKASYDLLEFDKYVQTPNDAYATRLRLAILVMYMRRQFLPALPKEHEYLKALP